MENEMEAASGVQMLRSRDEGLGFTGCKKKVQTTVKGLGYNLKIEAGIDNS